MDSMIDPEGSIMNPISKTFKTQLGTATWL